MAEVKVGLRYNNDADEVELTVDGEVALTSGKDVFESWVKAYLNKHTPATPVAEPVEEKVVEPAGPAEQETEETSSTVEVDN